MLRALGATRGAGPARRCGRGVGARLRRVGARDRRRARLSPKLLNAPLRRGRVRHPALGRGAGPADDRPRRRRRRRRHPDRGAGARRCGRCGSPPVAALSPAPRPSVAARPQRAGGDRGADVWLGGAALAAQGLFGSGPAGGRLGGDAGGAVLMFVGVALVARYIVRPLARRGRLPDRARLPHHRATGARERRAQPGPHGGHVGRADGRSRAGGLRRRLRRRAEVELRAARSTSWCGPTSSSTGQGLSAAAGSGSRTRSRTFDGVQPWSPNAVRPARGQRGEVEQRLRRDDRGRPEQLTEVYTFDWLEGDDSLVGGARPVEVLIEEQFAEAHDLGVGDKLRRHDAERRSRRR